MEVMQVKLLRGYLSNARFANHTNHKIILLKQIQQILSKWDAYLSKIFEAKELIQCIINPKLVWKMVIQILQYPSHKPFTILKVSSTLGVRSRLLSSLLPLAAVNNCQNGLTLHYFETHCSSYTLVSNTLVSYTLVSYTLVSNMFAVHCLCFCLKLVSNPETRNCLILASFISFDLISRILKRGVILMDIAA